MTTIAIPPGMPQFDDVPRYDVAKVRADFPILDRDVNGHRLVYLDSANTSHKPRRCSTCSQALRSAQRQRVALGAHLPAPGDRGLRGRGRRSPRSSTRSSVDEVVHKNSTEAIIVAYAFSNASLRVDADGSGLGPGDEW
jgi:cysteine desulfurase/selenocysteine lyase